MIDNFSPGQLVQCTVTKVPKRADQQATIARLMRQDPEIRNNLKHAQKRRRKNMRYKTRGGRPWAIRPRAVRYANVNQDASWRMRFVPQIAPDLKSVQQFIDIKPAS